MRRFKHILYVHDEESDAASATFRLALQLARRTGGRVDALQIVETARGVGTAKTFKLLRARSLELAEKSLEELVSASRTEDFHALQVVDGKPHIEIVREVMRNNHDLVIKPVGRSGPVDRLLGTPDRRLLRHCPCPVWLSRGEAFGEFDVVLAAVDIEDPEDNAIEEALNRQILEVAFSLCEANEAYLHIGHAWFPVFEAVYRSARFDFSKADLDEYLRTERQDHRNRLNRLMRKAENWVGSDIFNAVAHSTHLPKGPAETEIPQLARTLKADLVVMGTVARSGLSGVLMGNTAETILDRIGCSVLAVKPPGFASRIEL